MLSRLYQFRIKRPGEEIALAQIIAPIEDDAHQHFLDREGAPLFRQLPQQQKPQGASHPPSMVSVAPLM